MAPRVHVRAFRTRRMADAGRPRTRQSLRLIEGFSEINTFLLRRLARVYMGTRPPRHKVGKTGSGRLVRPGDPVAALSGNTNPMQERHISRARWRWNKSCLIHSRFSFHLQFGIVICLIMRTLRDSHPPHYRSIEALGDLIDPANKLLVQCNSGCYVLDG